MNRLPGFLLALYLAPALPAASTTVLSPGTAGGVAILSDDLPVAPAMASPDSLSRILRQAGMNTVLLNCRELGNANTFNHDEFEVVLLPYGPSFPVQAADNFRKFLRDGGKFLSTGGYAFDDLLERTTNGWQRPRPPALPRVSQVLWRYRIPADEIRDRGKLTFSGFLKAQNVRGSGMAYFAVYQFALDGGITEWQDVCRVRGSQDWKEFQHAFRVHPQSKTVELHAGLYQCSGVAWFDDVQLTDADGRKMVTTGFEEPFDPDSAAEKQWRRSDKDLCAVQSEVRHSGQRALQAALHYSLPPEERLNTRHGIPEDGLTVEPTQLGVFQPDYPLERVRFARPAYEQVILRPDWRVEHLLEGHAAAGVTGFEDARWIPLLNGYDRYGRLRGAAGALLRHYAGTYAGSSWAFFGVTNRDLFAESDAGAAEALVSIVRSLARDTYVAWLVPDRGCYREGEEVKLLANVADHGRRGASLRLTLRIYEGEPVGLEEPPIERMRAELKTNITLSAQQFSEVAFTWKAAKLAADYYYVLGQLWDGAAEIDRIPSGFVVQKQKTIASGPKLNFRDNYLRIGRRPRFLFGTDDWAYVFNTKRETPLQWLRDMRLRRDFGVQIYENLQFGALPPFTSEGGGEPREQMFRKVDGVVQLAQKYQQVYFAGLLVGYNAAPGDTELKSQREFCREFARRYASVPGLIHYLNGDLRCQLTDAVTPQWNAFLRERYGTTESLRAAWGRRASAEEIGKIPAEDFNDWGQAWDDMKVCDLNHFRAWLIRRWHTNLIASIRESDRTHLTSSEFYQLPHQGVDLPAAIDGVDLANFGYFDKPGADLARFPAICKYNDQRARGKSVGPGEYGVKTHPAWGDGKDYGYHITRTREQAIELFLGIAHYSLGLGASRIHNWCWKDSAHHVFPWGMVYPCDGVPKDTAYVHRNQSLLFRHFAPVYREPSVYVLTADSHRLGGDKWQVIEGILKSFDLALATHAENLGTLNEQGLQIPKSARVIFWPLPFCPTDETCAKVLDWVRQGGCLYLSGDISYDEYRMRSRTNRLQEFCGVRFLAENHPNLKVNSTNAADQPCIKVESVAGQVLEVANDGSPLLVENRVGKGRVLFTADPVELHAVADRREKDLALYRRVLDLGSVKPLGLEPNDPRIHLFRLPLQDGGRVYVLFNTDESQPARTVTLTDCRPSVTLTVARRRPALLWFDGRNALRAVEAQGDCRAGSDLILADGTRGIVMALDGQDVRRSRALLLLPLQTGTLRLAQHHPWRGGVVATGEIRDGTWRTYETAPLATTVNGLAVEVSPDQAVSLMLICESHQRKRWTQTVARAMTDPASLP
jgi:hypothetical protein